MEKSVGFTEVEPGVIEVSRVHGNYIVETPSPRSGRQPLTRIIPMFNLVREG